MFPEFESYEDFRDVATHFVAKARAENASQQTARSYTSETMK
jgi:hypothetical protein